MWYEWNGSSTFPNSISQNLEILRIQCKRSPNVVRMNCDLTIQNFPNTLKLSVKSSCFWAVVWQSNSCFIPNWSLNENWVPLTNETFEGFWFHEVQFSSLWISGILFLKILWIKKFRIFIKGFYRENHIQKL